MTGRWELTEEQWVLVEPVLRPARREDNRGRPWHETRAVLNGVLWVLGTGAQWRELPEKYRKRGGVAGLLIVPVCGCVHDFGCGHNLYEWIG